MKIVDTYLPNRPTFVSCSLLCSQPQLSLPTTIYKMWTSGNGWVFSLFFSVPSLSPHGLLCRRRGTEDDLVINSDGGSCVHNYCVFSAVWFFWWFWGKNQTHKICILTERGKTKCRLLDITPITLREPCFRVWGVDLPVIGSLFDSKHSG
jgi:hypothetical protein